MSINYQAGTKIIKMCDNNCYYVCTLGFKLGLAKPLGQDNSGSYNQLK